MTNKDLRLDVQKKHTQLYRSAPISVKALIMAITKRQDALEQFRPYLYKIYIYIYNIYIYVIHIMYIYIYIYLNFVVL